MTTLWHHICCDGDGVAIRYERYLKAPQQPRWRQRACSSQTIRRIPLR